MEDFSMNDNFVEQQLREMSKTIKNIREIYGITQSHLANLMGVSRSVIADIEQEKRFPELFNLFKLCDTLGITATELSAFTYQNWTMNINTDERAELHKEMFKSAQKTVYENAMEWRRKGN
jgi:transcriptional regulator with XRE-family HTH domain